MSTRAFRGIATRIERCLSHCRIFIFSFLSLSTLSLFPSLKRKRKKEKKHTKTLIASSILRPHLQPWWPLSATGALLALQFTESIVPWKVNTPNYVGTLLNVFSIFLSTAWATERVSRVRDFSNLLSLQGKQPSPKVQSLLFSFFFCLGTQTSLDYKCRLCLLIWV